MDYAITWFSLFPYNYFKKRKIIRHHFKREFKINRQTLAKNEISIIFVFEFVSIPFHPAI